MAIAKVQSTTGAGPTIVLSGVVAGNALTLQSCPFRNVATGVAEAIPTDSQGTFLRSRADAPSALSGEEVMASCFHQLNCAAGTHTVTPEANLVLHLTLTEWSGLTAIDQSVAAQNSSGVATSQSTGTTGTTAQAEELSLVQFAMGAVSGGSANVGLSDPQTNYTTLRIGQNDASDLANQHAYQILSAVGPQALTFVWTFSAANQWWQASIVTFKGATPPSTGAYQQEQNSTDRYQLEDGSGVYLIEPWGQTGVFLPPFLQGNYTGLGTPGRFFKDRLH